MSQQCLLCRSSPPVTGRFCEDCVPDSCPNCGVAYVYYDRNQYEWNCSHGCSFDGAEYAAKTFYTYLLNSDPRTILSYAGLRTELIIPKGTSVNVLESFPEQKKDEMAYGTHYSKHSERILQEGVRYPDDLPEGISSNMSEYDSETIRENALYAWPYNPSFTEKELSWTSDYVIFEVPEEAVRVSSYRILDYTSPDCERRDYCIPFEYYDDRLTYDVNALRRAVVEFERPVPRDALVA